MLFYIMFFYVCIDMVEPAIVLKHDPEVYSVDIVEYFVSKEKKKYEDIDEMNKWAHCQAIKAEFRFIIDKSYSDSKSRNMKLDLACERSGNYKGTKKSK